MGQKVSAHGIRLGFTSDWSAKWYAKPRNYSKLLYLDLCARKYLETHLKRANLGSIVIERLAQAINISAYVARPGVIIGKKGEGVDLLRKHLEDLMKMPVNLSIHEVRRPELDAKIVAENIASQLVRRIMFRRAMKRAVASTMRMGALGVKITLSGRLGGAEIARSECYQEGSMPLHTFKAVIREGRAEAKTEYGICGVKVLIYEKKPTSRVELDNQLTKKRKIVTHPRKHMGSSSSKRD